ncbi:MAG: zinc transporter ZntB [Puniceicoccaceae bacterium]
MNNPQPSPNPQHEGNNSGLLNAFTLNGQGGGNALEWEHIRDWHKEGAPLWVHLDRKSRKAQSWLRHDTGLSPVICNALLAEETRPRAQVFEDGMLVILRGVNLNPGEQPDDMISVRVWIEANRIITLRAPKLMAVSDVRDSLNSGRGPASPMGVLVSIIENLGHRMAPVVANLDELTDQVEESMLEDPDTSLRLNLVNIRRQAIALRRYLAPQREAISYLIGSQAPWIQAAQKAILQECRDAATRYVEDLDSIRERSSIVHEELSARMSEQMNRTMFLLSIVAGIFLPLGFVTGLLGINVGGMPGVDNPYAFGIVCLLLIAMGLFGVWIFRRMRLF